MKTVQKTKSFYYGFIIIAVLLLSCLCVAFALLQKTVSAEDVPPTYETTYVGEVIDAEEYLMADNTPAEGLTVVYPSGGIYGGKSFIMEQAGWYKVTYYATVNDVRVEETREYLAIRKPQNLIVAEEGMEIDFGKYEVESPYEMKKETYGAIVTFKAGQSISFSSNLKTKDLTKDYNILDLIVMPSVFKETDFEKLTVRIADSENPDNYVEVIIVSSNAVDGDGQVSYIRAGANGQQVGGWEGSTYHIVNYGTSVEHSFRALGRQGDSRKNHTISEHSLTVSMDHKEKKIYCGPISNASDEKLLVNDLDDEGNYKGNPWGGFTSEEVTVTVTAGQFIKSTGKVLFKQFGDYDLSNEIIDDVAPRIVVEYEDWDKTPVAEVGKPFAIFPFTANDGLDAQLKTNVWVYYVDESGREITVDHDGKSFLAKYAGTYKIVYRAEDYSGNVDEQIVQIVAMESTPNILIAIEETLVEKDVYETVAIPLASQMQAFGGSGCLTVERAVYAPDKSLLDVKGELQLSQLGDYKVIYTVSDYLGNVEYGVMTIRSQEIDAPKFVETPAFNEQLMAGFVYDLPQVLAIETVNGKIVQLACNTYVNDVLTKDSFMAEGTEVSIRYEIVGSTGDDTKAWVIPVVDAEFGKYKSKYFYTEDQITLTDEKNYLEFSFSNDSAVTFVNPVSAQNLTATFSYVKENTKFEKMTLVLTDAKDRELSVTAALFYDKADDSWSLQLQNSKGRIGYTTSKEILTFGYSNGKITDTSGVAIASISTYDNGEPFQGFSDCVYLTIAFEGVQEASLMRMTQLCNQSMGHGKSDIKKAMDEIKPVIILDEPFIMRQTLGSKANIPTAKAFDVLGQISEFTVTLTKVDGTLLASGDATKPIDFTLNEAGSYNVEYVAKDTNGNTEKVPYTILVNDTTAPTLQVKNNLKSSYKVGDKITLPSYAATDNGNNCYIQVTLIFPNNEMRLLQYSNNGEITSLLDRENDIYDGAFKADSNSFIALQAGAYVLRFVAYDEYYNYTVQEIEFTVK